MAIAVLNATAQLPAPVGGEGVPTLTWLSAGSSEHFQIRTPRDHLLKQKNSPGTKQLSNGHGVI